MSRRLARRATEALIRQEMDTHPVERDYPDTRRVRDIRAALTTGGEEDSEDAVARQFRYETGRTMPGLQRPGYVTEVQPSPASAPRSQPPVGRED